MLVEWLDTLSKMDSYGADKDLIAALDAAFEAIR